MHRPLMQQVHHPVLFCCVATCLLVASGTARASGNAATNNWAVILSSSRFFFNIRHTSSALEMYNLCRKYGIDDDHILLLLGESYACDARNPFPTAVYSTLMEPEPRNLYGCSVQADYAGYDVDVQHFLGILQGRYDENTPPSRRLNTDENSNILIYVSGHSAESFFKFQDSEFMGAEDVSSTMMIMWEQRRYHKVVLILDTCHALSLCLTIKAPNVLCITSSDAESESYSRGTEPVIGFSLVSQWVFETQHLLSRAKCFAKPHEETALQMSWFDFNYGDERQKVPLPHSVPSHLDVVNEPNAIHQWRLEEFFCSRVRESIPVPVRYDLFIQCHNPPSCTTGPVATEGNGPMNIAPKKAKRRIVANIDASALLERVPRDPGAHAELSTAELERKIDEWSKMNPEELERLYRQLEKQEEEESRVLVEDSLYQMDVSMRDRSKAAVRVFWKDVDVAPLDGFEGWYTVLVDGRKVKAFESSRVLAIPSEAMAYACAREYAEQKDYLNKLLMPMVDMCSGALTVAPQMIPPRVDYLMSFYQNDNMYFRAAPIAGEQDRIISPVAEWFERVFEVNVPRIVGIGHPNIPSSATLKVRDALLAMSMNPYQIVALCVATQFTSSLLLPLAMFNRIIDLPTVLSINRAEEGHNTSTEGLIEGYHDIREADVVTKLCACAATWQLMKDIPLSKCMMVPRNDPVDESL